MREPILKQDYVHWRHDPVTQALIHDLTAIREEYKEEWAQGKFQGEIQQGVVQGLMDALLYITQDFNYLEDENAEDNTSQL